MSERPKMSKELREYSPSFRKYTENEQIFVRDNSIEIVNRGNTIAWIDDFPLEPNDFIRTPFTKPENICVWKFFLKFGKENVMDNGQLMNGVFITRTNFHGNQFSNYKPKE
jgi:hypothetical protein